MENLVLAFDTNSLRNGNNREHVPLAAATKFKTESALNIRIQEAQAIITSDPLPSVHADLPQLVQVFQNLIGNALKYRAPNGSPHIHIAAEHQGNEWVISVQDNGIGFDTRQAERIFAICKRIVERHGGRIWATGEANKGATFFFTLPRKADEAITPAVSITYSATSG